MTAVTLTKSIRLLREEALEVARLSEQMAASEATLMKQWIRDGMRAQKIDLALRSYMQRQVDLRGAAAMAGVSYNRFFAGSAGAQYCYLGRRWFPGSDGGSGRYGER
jgi:hypothetical protein